MGKAQSWELCGDAAWVQGGGGDVEQQVAGLSSGRPRDWVGQASSRLRRESIWWP